MQLPVWNLKARSVLLCTPRSGVLPANIRNQVESTMLTFANACTTAHIALSGPCNNVYSRLVQAYSQACPPESQVCWRESICPWQSPCMTGVRASTEGQWLDFDLPIPIWGHFFVIAALTVSMSQKRCITAIFNFVGLKRRPCLVVE